MAKDLIGSISLWSLLLDDKSSDANDRLEEENTTTSSKSIILSNNIEKLIESASMTIYTILF